MSRPHAERGDGDGDGGAMIERLCPKCERAPIGPGAICPTCGVRLVDVSTAGALIGTVLDGRFEIRALLGEGGMGTVYRAWQRSVGREVAVKVIDRTRVRDGMTVRRFLREAKLASQLSHPATVSVIDFGQSEDGRLFIAMELVRGRTLAAAIAADGPMPLARVLAVGMQLCDALEAAHGLAIVHRDLKPANVMLVDDPAGRDRIKVLDFGLAKSLVGDDTEATQTGDLVGTPRYLAPELVGGAPVTAQSDLYAVGVILAELTLGRRLFDGNQMAELLWQKAHAPIVPAEVPAELALVVARLIDPDPGRRPRSAAALRRELAGIAGAAGAGARAGADAGADADAGAGAGADADAGAGAGTATAWSEPTPRTAPIRFTATPRPEPAVAESAPPGRARSGLLLIGALAVAAIAAAIFFVDRSGSSSSSPSPSSAEPAHLEARPSPPAVAPTVTVDAASMGSRAAAPADGGTAVTDGASGLPTPPDRPVRERAEPRSHHRATSPVVPHAPTHTTPAAKPASTPSTPGSGKPVEELPF